MLSPEETGGLEHYGRWPTCKAHRHVSESDAIIAVRAETHRFVGGPDTRVEFVSAIVEVNTTRVWSPVQCHDAAGKSIMGMRSWGLKPLK